MSTAVLTDRARIRSRKPGAKRSICASIRPDMSTSEPAGTWQYPHSVCCPAGARVGSTTPRSEEHTSELQSHSDLVCRLLLEKKKKQKKKHQEPKKKKNKLINTKKKNKK